MYSNILRDLLNDYEFQDKKKFKSIRKVEGRSNSSKMITSFREDFILEKIAYSGEHLL